MSPVTEPLLLRGWGRQFFRAVSSWMVCPGIRRRVVSHLWALTCPLRSSWAHSYNYKLFCDQNNEHPHRYVQVLTTQKQYGCLVKNVFLQKTWSRYFLLKHFSSSCHGWMRIHGYSYLNKTWELKLTKFNVYFSKYNHFLISTLSTNHCHCLNLTPLELKP